MAGRARHPCVSTCDQLPGRWEDDAARAHHPRTRQPTGTIAVIEGDQETLLDAERIQAAGPRQCRSTPAPAATSTPTWFTAHSHALDPEPESLLFIENVGNLVCPAHCSTSASTAKLVVISVTEGADKPLKYPHMFAAAGLGPHQQDRSCCPTWTLILKHVWAYVAISQPRTSKMLLVCHDANGRWYCGVVRLDHTGSGILANAHVCPYDPLTRTYRSGVNQDWRSRKRAPSTILAMGAASPGPKAVTHAEPKQQSKRKKALIHVLWINAGLSCDGDSVALTAATQPSIEEIALWRTSRSAQDRRPLAADRLRVRPHRRRGRFPGVVLQGRTRRAGAVRPCRRGSDPERAAQGRRLLVRVRQRPGDRSADDDQRVAGPADAEGHRRRRGRDLRHVRRHPRDGRQPDRCDGRARLSRAGTGRARPASRSSACRAARSSRTTWPRR